MIWFWIHWQSSLLITRLEKDENANSIVFWSEILISTRGFDRKGNLHRRIEWRSDSSNYSSTSNNNNSNSTSFASSHCREYPDMTGSLFPIPSFVLWFRRTGLQWFLPSLKVHRLEQVNQSASFGSGCLLPAVLFQWQWWKRITRLPITCRR